MTTRSGAYRAQSSGPLNGSLQAPGDKSISHRCFILGALADGVTTATGVLESDDVLNSAKAATALGAHIERTGDRAWSIRGMAGVFNTPEAPLDFGNAGTGVRLMMGAVAGAGASARFIGDVSLSSRPMRRVTDPLGQMGARFKTTEGRLPAMLMASKLSGIDYTPPIASAQVKSAILLAGLGAEGETIVREPSLTRDHTETMLKAFGVSLDVEKAGAGNIVRLPGRQVLKATHIDVPGDPSSAAFAIVAALITPGSEVTLEGVMDNPARTGLLHTLKDMGGDIDMKPGRIMAGEKTLDIRVRHSALEGVTVPAERAPSMIDEYPILGVAAALAEGETRMLGLEELRAKESDRLSATAALLSANGVNVEAGADSLTVTGSGGDPIKGGGRVETHHDHRIAMSALVLGGRASAPVEIDDAAMIATSYPNFFDQFAALGARIEAAS